MLNLPWSLHVNDIYSSQFGDIIDVGLAALGLLIYRYMYVGA
jgi:hypothetical protein